MSTIIVFFLLAPLLLINLVFVAEVLAGLARPSGGEIRKVTNRVIIVVPAHNEAGVIGRTLDELMNGSGSDFPILVVADNCSDETAPIARKTGATVIERDNLDHRGKGHALSFAREWLRQAQPEVVIVLDADCRTDGASLHNLAAACVATHRPCQAINLLEWDREAVPLVQISTFAFLIKNLVRQRGLQRLTGAVHLTGTGMGLPWDLFDRADLATSNIVEDVRLGIEMSRGGAHPQLVENSFVWSAHADLRNTLGQRSRWEGGFLATGWAAALEAIIGGLKTLRPRAVLSGLDLLVPPVALLAMINAVVLLVAAITAAADLSSWAPVWTLSIVGALMCAALIIAWWREGRESVSGGALLRLPLYALWKVPMYLALLKTGAPSEWLRTARPGKKDREA